MTRASRDARRRLEAELGDLPTPPPPSDLFDRIRDEIPDDLSAANAPAGGRRAWHRRPLVRLAASLAVVAIGISIAYRVEKGQERQLISATGRSGVDPTVAPRRPDSTPTPVRVGGAESVEAPRRVITETKAVAVAAPPTTDGGAGDTTTGSRASKDVGRADSLVAPPQSAEPTPPSQESVRSSGRADRLADASIRPADEQIARKREELMGQLQELRSMPAETDVVFSLPRAAAGTAESESPGAEGKVAVDNFGSVEPPAGGRTKRVPVPERPGFLESAPVPPSTGGSAEPLDRPYGDMFFRPTGVNPFVDTAEDRLSTFALDVDTGSWTLARSYLERGHVPPPESIRVEEFVNAQAYDDPAPRRGDFTLVAEGAPSPFADGAAYRLVRFAVKAREVDRRDRKPVDLVFVVDVSGSMRQENRLGLVKRALGLLLRELGPEDRVGLVVYGSRGQVLLEPTRDHEAIAAAIARLRPGGSTNAEEGLTLGYDLFDRSWRSDRVHRVILCSDGVANVGATGPESILARIGEAARRGVGLTTVGFGMGNYNDALMEQLADQGDGSYHYVDSLDEARRIFVENLTGTLETVAGDAKVQVDFDPETVEGWRLLGYENRDVADRDFRNDAVDAGEIGAGHSASALYEIRLAPRASGRDRLATLRLRWESRATGRVEEASLDLRVRDLESSFGRASRDLRVAAVAAELAERLKGSFYAKDAAWDALVAEADRLRIRGFAPAGERDDLRWMVERAAELDRDPARRPAPFDD